MKTRALPEWSYMLWVFLGVLNVVQSGCSGIPPASAVSRDKQQTDMARKDAKRALGEQERMLNGLFAILKNPESEDRDFDRSLNQLSSLYVSESPQTWAYIVDDSRISDVRRRKCLFELFKRHIRPGTSVQSLGMLLVNRGWFNDETITTATAYSSLPFDRGIGECAFMFTLPFMVREHSALFLRIKPVVGKKELLVILNGQTRTNSIEILEVGFTEPRRERLESLF